MQISQPVNQPVRITDQNTKYLPGFSSDAYEAKAADLGIDPSRKPWDWPRQIPTDLGNKKDFVRQFMGVERATYQQQDSMITCMVKI